MNNRVNETYVRKTSAKDISELIKALILPAAMFFLCMVTIAKFKNFGRLLMAPTLAIMWAFGTFCAFWLPSHRRVIVQETLGFIFSYNALMLVLRFAVSVTANISSDMLVESFDHPILNVTGNILPGYLQNALYIAAVALPAAFLGMEVKRLVQFRRSSSKDKAIQRIRGLRGSKDPHPY